jgi:1-acyl-sn-glycerol-3-phosphate acyltransferase
MLPDDGWRAMSEAKSSETPDYEKHTLRGRPRKFVRAVVLAICRVLARLKIEGIANVPTSGAVLVVSNHLHNADPVLTIAAFPRPVHYMAKKEAYNVPGLKQLMNFVGAFPVDRGKADRNAIRRAEGALAQGIPVGMFPEGTRSVTRSLQRAHAGAGMLALKSGVPVIPLVITGSEALPFNGKKGKVQASSKMPERDHKGVRLLFGQPFVIPRMIGERKIGTDEATEIIMVEIARLLPPDYRGVYADALAGETVRRAILVNPTAG